MGNQPGRAQNNNNDGYHINNSYNKRYLESEILTDKIPKKELIKIFKNSIFSKLAFNKKINKKINKKNNKKVNKKINQNFRNNLEKYKSLKINNYNDLLYDGSSFQNSIDIIHYYYYHHDEYITFEAVKDEMIYILDKYQLDIIYDYYISENRIDNITESNILNTLQDILDEKLISIILTNITFTITAINYNFLRIDGGMYTNGYYAGSRRGGMGGIAYAT